MNDPTEVRVSGRRNRGEYPDIAVVPIAKETAGCQFIVTWPFSAKVPDGHAAAKMKERVVRTDGNSAGVEVVQLCLRGGHDDIAAIPVESAAKSRDHHDQRQNEYIGQIVGGADL
jgi:hypothetical protein